MTHQTASMGDESGDLRANCGKSFDIANRDVKAIGDQVRLRPAGGSVWPALIARVPRAPGDNRRRFAVSQDVFADRAERIRVFPSLLERGLRPPTLHRR